MLSLSRGIFLVLFFISLISPVKSQNKDTTVTRELVFALPVFDLPYQLDAAATVGEGNITAGSFLEGYSNPGMPLLNDLTADLYTGVHYGINSLFKVNSGNEMRPWTRGKRLLYSLTLCGSDFLLIYMPGFDGWLHEEYHRAVMTRFGVDSFNDMNKFPLGAELVNVSHVKDEDLERFKEESPADFIRSQVSGIEGEYLLIDKLQRNNFFYEQNLPHEILYLLAALNSILYVQTCSDPDEADKLTDEANKKETTTEVRDFTGLDFLGWTYDIFKPDEPYSYRGIHPSGTGIDRYIKTTDLTDEEASYLKKQGYLQWLNVLSPMMIGFRSIKLNDNGLSGNISLRHLLTSFGSDISVNLFLMKPAFKYVFILHNYQNYKSYFPGIEVQRIDWPLPLFSQRLYLSPRLMLGLQPSNQEFKTGKASFTGLAECKLELESENLINPFIELSAKTAGWVAGNEYLSSNLSIRLGISSRILTGN